ncbi:hypothetical protein [Neomoorella thermoacetica]|uniref:hypothetical protein n=1 Tax=Neomoorella thermoacetica TaxID=1525 RepID=UPI0030CF81D8
MYLKIITRNFKIVLKGKKEDFVDEALETRLFAFLSRIQAWGEAITPAANLATVEQIDEEDTIPVSVDNEPGVAREKAAAAKEAGDEEIMVHSQSISELRARATISNNKELATLVVYYSDYCKKQPPATYDVRRIMREELREKAATVNSVSTYLQRARREGWVDLDGKKWRITSTGLQMIEKMLR